MKFSFKEVSAYVPINRLQGFAAASLLVLLTAGGCGSDGGSFQEIGDNANGADDGDGRLRNLNELVISQCQDLPENTVPVALDGLVFTDPRPENNRPENSDTTRACINGS